jgi:hypothetical protein
VRVTAAQTYLIGVPWLMIGEDPSSALAWRSALGIRCEQCGQLFRIKPGELISVADCA